MGQTQINTKTVTKGKRTADKARQSVLKQALDFRIDGKKIISRKELASRAGTSVQHISHIANGNKQPSISTGKNLKKHVIELLSRALCEAIRIEDMCASFSRKD